VRQLPRVRNCQKQIRQASKETQQWRKPEHRVKIKSTIGTDQCIECDHRLLKEMGTHFSRTQQVCLLHLEFSLEPGPGNKWTICYRKLRLPSSAFPILTTFISWKSSSMTFSREPKAEAWSQTSSSQFPVTFSPSSVRSSLPPQYLPPPNSSPQFTFHLTLQIQSSECVSKWWPKETSLHTLSPNSLALNTN
jgi:hypothetical protein